MMKGIVTEMEGDVLILPANNDLLLGGEITGEVGRAAGPELQQELNRVAPIPLGHIAVTKGYQLKFQTVIHAAVMPVGLWTKPKWVSTSFGRAMAKCAQMSAGVVVTPPLGINAGYLSVNRSIQLMGQELFNFMMRGGEAVGVLKIVLAEDPDLRDAQEMFNTMFANKQQ